MAQKQVSSSKTSGIFPRQTEQNLKGCVNIVTLRNGKQIDEKKSERYEWGDWKSTIIQWHWWGREIKILCTSSSIQTTHSISTKNYKRQDR